MIRSGSDDARIKKIWVAMSTPFQANFFAPLIKEMQKDYEFLIMARNHDNIFSILEAKKIDFVPVGRHGGKELPGKLEAYAQTIQQMLPIVKKEKPDLLLTERWPEAVRVAFGFNIPSWCLFYDEREKHVNQMVFPIASKVFVPRFYTFQELYQQGVIDPEKVVWFNGFHTCYLKDEQVSSHNPYKELGIDSPVVFVRPEPEFASFFPNHEPVLEKAVSTMSRDSGISIAVLPRTQRQAERYSKMGVNVLNGRTSESPVVHADLTLGAAETMLMEAFVLGKPAVSAIYWQASKPVMELHRYIEHSTDPKQIEGHVLRLLSEDEKRAFRERAALLVNNMDNPVKLIMEEIRRIDEKERLDVSSRRRSKLEILIDIIQAASLRPLRPTHIMRAANISYNELKGIIEGLERKGLIRSETTFGGKFYQATGDGLKILEEYRGMKERLLAK